MHMTRLLLPILLTPLLVAACSTAQLAYRNADFLIGGYVEDLLDLDEQQVAILQPRLEEALGRHREAELPAVVALLAGFERGAKTGFDEAGLSCLRDRAWALWHETARLLAEASAPLLVDLDAAQLALLRDRFEERSAEYREDHLAVDAEQRQEARLARMVKRISRWTGRLDGPQRELIARHVVTWPSLAQGWYDYRSTMQARLLAMIESGASRDDMQRFLVGWWAWQADMPAALRTGRTTVENSLQRLFIDLQQSLGAEQHQRLVDELGDLRRSLSGLLPADAVAAAMEDMPCHRQADREAST